MGQLALSPGNTKKITLKLKGWTYVCWPWLLTTGPGGPTAPGIPVGGSGGTVGGNVACP